MSSKNIFSRGYKWFPFEWFREYCANQAAPNMKTHPDQLIDKRDGEFYLVDPDCKEDEIKLTDGYVEQWLAYKNHGAYPVVIESDGGFHVNDNYPHSADYHILDIADETIGSTSLEQEIKNSVDFKNSNFPIETWVVCTSDHTVSLKFNASSGKFEPMKEDQDG